MLKILYLVTQSEFGGAQRYIFDLATHLDSQQFEVIVAAGGDGELFERCAAAGIKTRRCHHLERSHNPFAGFLAIWEIIKLLEQEKPDLLHLNSTNVSVYGSLAAWFYQRRTNQHLKVIYTVHGWIFNEPLPWWKKYFYLWLEKLTARLKDKIICVSEYDREMALKYKIADEQKSVTIHNGLDANQLLFLEKTEAKGFLRSALPHQMRDRFGRNDSDEGFLPRYDRGRNDIKTIIGTIANFYPTKGLTYLIEAVSHIPQPDVIFVIIGDGEQRPILKEKIKKLNLEKRVFLLGQIKNAWQYLKAFDIYICSSIKEGLPYSILEAMAAGLPIVSTNVGGILEMIEDKKTGLLITPADPAAITDAVFQLLDNPALAQILGRKAKEQIENFSLLKMTAETVKIYNSLD